METTKKNASKTSTVKAPETTTPQVQAKKLRVYFDGPSPLENGKPAEEQKEYWIVKVAEDQEAMPRYIYRILTYGKASALAAKIAADQTLELISTAKPE